MSSVKRTLILTGANRGIGRALAENLLLSFPKQFRYIFTHRSINHTLLKEQLQKVNNEAEFEVLELDITDKQSRKEFVSNISQKYHNFDILFNNAGVFNQTEDKGKRPSRQLSEYTLGTNFISTVNLTEELFPVLTDDGKIISMSAQLGQLKFQPPAAKLILNDESKVCKGSLFKLAEDYISNSEDETKDLILSNYAHHASKALLNAYFRFAVKAYLKPQQSAYLVHPGWVQTDLGGKQAPLTPNEACTHLLKVVAEYPFERHPMSGKLQFKNKDIGF